MEETAQARIERDARELCEGGDYRAAATVALKGYGAEVFGFLMAAHASESDATDTFSETSEALWRSLSTFAWQCSLRTWMYAIARNIIRTRRRDAARKRRRGAAVAESALNDVAQTVRTETLAFLRTEKRTRLQALRDSLPEDDRMLLVLRVDRKLPWNDLARVLRESEAETPPTAAEVAKDAARLRKQFQTLKDRLREMAKKEGLLG